MEKTIQIGVEPVRVEVNGHRMEFYPDDAAFMEGFQSLGDQAREMQKKYQQTQQKLDRRKAKGDDAHLQEVADMTAYYRECCETLHTALDRIFGEGTCDTVFGNRRILVNYVELLDRMGGFLRVDGDDRYQKYHKYAKSTH